MGNSPLVGYGELPGGEQAAGRVSALFSGLQTQQPNNRVYVGPRIGSQKVGIWRKRLRTPDLETGTREVSSSVVLKRNVVCVFADLEKAFD